MYIVDYTHSSFNPLCSQNHFYVGSLRIVFSSCSSIVCYVSLHPLLLFQLSLSCIRFLRPVIPIIFYCLTLLSNIQSSSCSIQLGFQLVIFFILELSSLLLIYSSYLFNKSSLFQYFFYFAIHYSSSTFYIGIHLLLFVDRGSFLKPPFEDSQSFPVKNIVSAA